MRYALYEFCVKCGVPRDEKGVTSLCRGDILGHFWVTKKRALGNAYIGEKMAKNTLTVEQRKTLWGMIERGDLVNAHYLEMALNTIDELESEIENYWKEQ